MSFKSLLISTIVLFFVSCSAPETNESSTEQTAPERVQIPEHLQDIENLKVISDHSPAAEITLTKTQTYGEIFLQLLPPQLGSGADMVVDEQGNVYRAHKGDRTVLVFNEEGEMIQQVGRAGRGPGEFQSVVALSVYEDQLTVFDSILSRISIFNTDTFELLETVSLDTKGWEDKVTSKYVRAQTIMGLNKDTYLTSVMEEKEDGSRYQAYYKMNSGGEIISGKIAETKNTEGHIGNTKQGHSAGIRLPFSEQGKISISDTGRIYHINTGEFLISIYDTDGNFQGGIYYPFEKDPLEEQEVLDEYHPNMHPVFDNAEYPDTWPALETLIVDDENRIWISAIVDDKTIYEWYILEESGALLATFTCPRDSEFLTVRNNKAYAEETDPETEAKVIAAYDISFTQ